ncbi:MFS transporter [Streptomyces sp. XY431]|uniref:MFS transporter n=1 Tax=Streptomyces sp. XY431 TaxID=1415562 RepID=UPI000A58CF5E|nr:MFS transporter [Streptomyces sp. XY431]
MIENDRGTSDPRLSPRRATALLAATSALTAANVYLGQPLLGSAAAALHVPPATLGAVPTATQIGYATGIAVLVPLGDSRDRRRLILGLCAASACALAASALAPTAGLLVVAAFALGLLSPVPQLVAPLAVALAGGRHPGRTVGTVQAGLLVGVLASRTYSGALAEAVGWRAVFGCSCALTLLLTLVLRRALPTGPPTTRAARATPYRELLASVPRLFATRPLVRRITVSGGLVGVSFGAFWTALTFLLEQRYHYGSTVVGLFGLVAVAGALASTAAGRLADRFGRRRAVAASIAVTAAAWALLLPGGSGILWLTVGVVVLDIGTWGNQVVCQGVLFTLDPALHSRLNTCWFTLRFLGIALGSLVGSVAWARGGWPAVVGVGAAASLAALLVAGLPEGRGRAAGRSGVAPVEGKAGHGRQVAGSG